MSAKRIDKWEDEVDDDDDEEDFVPGAYDEEEDDSDAHYDDEVDPEDFPLLLEGEMFIDKVKGLCYEQDGLFFLLCKTTFPDGSFSFGAPIVGSPLLFAGWIKEPGNWMEFEVRISKEPMSMDPLETELLKAQEERQSNSRPKTATKTGVGMIDQKESTTKRDLKAPPSYSLKKSSGNTKDPDQVYKRNSGVLSSKAAVTKSDDTADNAIFVVSGTQIRNEGHENRNFTFRGSYRCQPQSPIERLHLICSIQAVEKGAAGSGKAVSAKTSSEAATSKKRSRSIGNDDDSVEENAFVAYQELIDLHDDTRLSTKELRRKYYGNGETTGENGKMQSVDTKRFKGTNDGGTTKEKVDDEDDDDAYGF